MKYLICENLDINKPITTISDWENKFPPQGGKTQWVKGRSAYENANEWMNNNGSNVEKFLLSSKQFCNISYLIGTPEYETKFDKYSGKGRQHDLLLIDKCSKYVISIEAKVDEPFGPTILEKYHESLKAKDVNEKSNQLNRLKDLTLAVFGKDLDQLVKTNDELLQMRYQLLHSIAGVLSEGKKQGSTKALLLIHIFKTHKIDSQKHNVNTQELNAFVKQLSNNQCNQILKGQIIGPFYIKGNDHIPSDIPLYIGKVES